MGEPWSYPEYEDPRYGEEQDRKAEAIAQAYAKLGDEVSVWEAMLAMVEAGEEPGHVADAMAQKIGPVPFEDTQLEVSEVSQILESNLGYQKKGSDTPTNMPTDDVNIQKTFNDNPVPAQESEIIRFQTEAAKKSNETCLADGIDSNGRKVELWEIEERQVIRGPYVRWEVIDAASDEVIKSGGPLYLDDPSMSDAALAEARMNAFQFLKDMTGANMRLASKDERLSRLKKQVEGLKLTAAQKQIVADMEADIESYSEAFIDSVGSLFKHEWDVGSSWELVTEADGKSKLVRRELAADAGPELNTRHAFHAGQKLRRHSEILPDDVVVRECIGERRYRVQSEFNGTVYEAPESELYDPTVEESLFQGQGEIGIGELFT